MSTPDASLHYSTPRRRPTGDPTRIPNLFHAEFDRFKDLEFADLIKQLGQAEETRSLIMFFDGIRTWLFRKFLPGDLDLDILLQQIVDIKHERNWDKIPQDSIKYTVVNISSIRFFQYMTHSNLLVLTANDGDFIKFQSRQNLKFDELMNNEPYLHFYHRDFTLVGCSKPGHCGFMLKTKAASKTDPDAFNISLCIDEKEYPPDIHYHKELISANKMHLTIGALDTKDGGNVWRYYPMSYTSPSKPAWRDIGAYWMWGCDWYTYSDRHTNKIRVDVYHSLARPATTDDKLREKTEVARILSKAKLQSMTNLMEENEVKQKKLDEKHQREIEEIWSTKADEDEELSRIAERVEKRMLTLQTFLQVMSSENDNLMAENADMSGQVTAMSSENDKLMAKIAELEAKLKNNE